MANHWEKPGFEMVMLGAECTAYSGAESRESNRSTGLRQTTIRLDRTTISCKIGPYSSGAFRLIQTVPDLQR